MHHSKLLNGFSIFAFVLNCLLVFNFTVFAQCESVYFKTTTAKTLFPTPFYTYGAYEFTGDGKLDLLGSDSTNPATINKIYVSTGNGDGTFGLPTEIVLPVTATMEKTLVRDFNADGKNDILIRGFTNPAIIIIYQNNGNGTFTQLTQTVIPDDEQIKDLTDINNDGFADLIVISLSADTLYYRFGNADGSFDDRVQLGAAKYIVTGDFNNDGKIDIAAALEYTQAQSVRIYYNQGNGVFNSSDTFVDNDRAQDLFLAVDLNHDGKLGLLSRTNQPTNQDPQYPKKFTAFINHGNQNFSKIDYVLPDLNNPGGALNIMPGDFNGDGFIDLIFFTASWVRLYIVYINDGTGRFLRRDYNHIMHLSLFSWFLPGDFDGDNKTDLLKYSNNPGLIFPEARTNLLKNVCVKTGQTRIVDFYDDYRTHYTLWRESDGRWRSFIPSEPSSLIEFKWGKSGDTPTPGGL
jgi:hypothetical protein